MEPAVVNRPPQLRFETQGATGRRLRARGAAPLLVGGSHLVAAAAATGSDRALTVSERGVAWLAGRLAGIDFDVEGVEFIDPAQAYVVAPLHEGFADIPALLRLPLGLRFVARDELFRWPALGRYLAAAGHLEVVEQASRAETRDFFASARSVIQDGRSLVLFPQGSVLGLEVAFRPGPWRIAGHAQEETRRDGAPIVRPASQDEPRHHAPNMPSIVGAPTIGGHATGTWVFRCR